VERCHPRDRHSAVAGLIGALMSGDVALKSAARSSPCPRGEDRLTAGYPECNQSAHCYLRRACLLSGPCRFALHMSAFDPNGHALPRRLVPSVGAAKELLLCFKGRVMRCGG